MGDDTLGRCGQFFAAIDTKSVVITDFGCTAWAFHLITILGGLPVKAEKIWEAFCLCLEADYLSQKNKPNFGGIRDTVYVDRRNSKVTWGGR